MTDIEIARASRRLSKMVALAARPGSAGEGAAATNVLWHAVRTLVLEHGWLGATVAYRAVEGTGLDSWSVRIADLACMADRVDSKIAMVGNELDTVDCATEIEMTF